MLTSLSEIVLNVLTYLSISHSTSVIKGTLNVQSFLLMRPTTKVPHLLMLYTDTVYGNLS